MKQSKELVDKYEMLIDKADRFFLLKYELMELSKQCALIVITEKKKSLASVRRFVHKDLIDDWQEMYDELEEMQKEIEKL